MFSSKASEGRSRASEYPGKMEGEKSKNSKGSLLKLLPPPLFFPDAVSCHTRVPPSKDPINPSGDLPSPLSGTLISACDEGDGGQLFLSRAEAAKDLVDLGPQRGGCNSIFCRYHRTRYSRGAEVSMWEGRPSMAIGV